MSLQVIDKNLKAIFSFQKRFVFCKQSNKRWSIKACCWNRSCVKSVLIMCLNNNKISSKISYNLIKHINFKCVMWIKITTDFYKFNSIFGWKMANLQLTLSILKPCILKNPLATHLIYNLIRENNIEIVQRTTLKLTKSLAAKFYEEHQGKFFYNRLQTFMCR